MKKIKFVKLNLHGMNNSLHMFLSMKLIFLNFFLKKNTFFLMSLNIFNNSQVSYAITFKITIKNENIWLVFLM